MNSRPKNVSFQFCNTHVPSRDEDLSTQHLCQHTKLHLSYQHTDFLQNLIS